MGMLAKLKFVLPLPLSKIYPKNQLKSIGKNSFLAPRFETVKAARSLQPNMANKALFATLDCVALA
jgi:hypothetical protein